MNTADQRSRSVDADEADELDMAQQEDTNSDNLDESKIFDVGEPRVVIS